MRFKDTLGLSYYLRKTELTLTQKIDQVLTTLKLTLPKYSVLAILEENTNPLTNAELARAAFVTPQTMNRILISLESAGLVKRRPAKKGEIKIFYTLTQKAKKTICNAHSEVNQIEIKMVKGISKKNFNQFVNLLKQINLNLKQE